LGYETKRDAMPPPWEGGRVKAEVVGSLEGRGD